MFAQVNAATLGVMPHDITPAMLAMLKRHAEHGWWRWTDEDHPNMLTFRALEKRRLVYRRETVPMFPDLPGGERYTMSFLSREGWDELKSLGIDRGWKVPPYD